MGLVCVMKEVSWVGEMSGKRIKKLLSLGGQRTVCVKKGGITDVNSINMEVGAAADCSLQCNMKKVNMTMTTQVIVLIP